MNITATQRDRCRLCGSRDVRQFLEFSRYPLSDNHLKAPDGEGEFLFPYRAYWCADCRTAQNLTDFDWSSYYAEYDYTVSTSGFARQFMDRLTENAIGRYGLPAGSAVVEIGSSDGYQLSCFQRRGMKVFGYEPGRVLAQAAARLGVPTSTSLFTHQTLREIPCDMRPVQAFVSLYTLDHVPDPLACLQAIRSVLDPKRGLVIVEVHDLEKIVERREACLFCHEHTVYLTRESMARLMSRAGLKLVSIDLVAEPDRRGNSLLAVGAVEGSPIQPDLPPASDLAGAMDRDWAVYERFAAAVEGAHRHLGDYVRTQVAAGRRVAGYGASARAISTLSLASLTHEHIAYVCDANTNLHGMFLPKSHIPIAAPDRLGSAPVDEIIVFAYGYMREILAGLESFVRRGGKVTSLLDLLAAEPRGTD
jgi:SAM-dependent methyltransferase